jgi:hypothetical protein
MQFRAKNKIYGALFLWLILSVFMASAGFGLVEKSTEDLNRKYADRMGELNRLKAENLSFIESKKDLADLRKKALQPEDFFSRDTSLVKEVEYLESLTAFLGLDFTLSGLSGTVKSAAKAKTNSADLVVLPYSISVDGSFSAVSSFIKTMEHLPFASQISAVNINAEAENKVRASFPATFYILK